MKKINSFKNFLLKHELLRLIIILMSGGWLILGKFTYRALTYFNYKITLSFWFIDALVSLAMLLIFEWIYNISIESDKPRHLDGGVNKECNNKCEKSNEKSKPTRKFMKSKI